MLTEHEYPRRAVPLETIARIDRVAERLVLVQEKATEYERVLKSLRLEERTLAEETLPELMSEAGTDELSVGSGKLKIVREIKANITAANQAAAFAWFDANGYGGLIKREIVARFEKGQEDEARELVEELEGRFPLRVGGSVYTGTLKKEVRLMLEAGKTIPDSISYHVRNVAKIK